VTMDARIIFMALRRIAQAGGRMNGGKARCYTSHVAKSVLR
jgi:hypothetical protein